MIKLNIFEKLVFGLAMLLLALVAVTEIFPSLWETFPVMEKEATFSGTDIAMIGLTFGIVFFAGMQALLQWRHHKFERKMHHNNHVWRLYEPRTQIFKVTVSCLIKFTRRDFPDSDFLDDFSDLFLEKAHCLPDNMQQEVYEIFEKVRRYRALVPALEKAIQAELNHEPKATIDKDYGQVRAEASEIINWFDDGVQRIEFSSRYRRLLDVLESQ